MIKYATQDLSKKDIQEVIKSLNSDYLTQGPYIEKFEKKLSNYCKSKYSVAVNSATNALHLSYLALGLKKGDYLWTSPITFVSTANAARYCGAKVDFVDIDISTFNISLELLEEKLKKSKKIGKLPKIVVPVHLGGQSCDMRKIHNLSKQYGFKIVEDASHSIGGKYETLPIGSCQYSDICVFSFHPVKIITTGEGGAIMTNKYTLYNKVKSLRSHGITKIQKKSRFIRNEIWNYKQSYLGFNYRMTDIQAALGFSQLNRIDNFINKRNVIANKYNTAFKNLPLFSQSNKNNSISSFHLYLFRIDKNKTNKTRNQLYSYLEKSKIQPNFHYIPVYRHKYYKSKKLSLKKFSESENYFNTAITIPLHTKLKKKDQDFIIGKIKNFFNK